MATNTGVPRQSRDDLLPEMRKASEWLLADPSRKVKEALQKFKVPYNSFWRFHWRQANPKAITTQATIDKNGGVESAWFRNKVAQHRNAEGQSWGEIMSRYGDDDFGLAEGLVRRAYSQATNRASQGSRVNHGGRFYGGPEFADVLYRSHDGDAVDRKANGSVLKPGAKAYEAAQEIQNGHKPAAKRRPTKKAPSATKRQPTEKKAS